MVKTDIVDNLSYKIVKILPQSININWRLPFQIGQPRISMGSGFFINKHGYILTCTHVVENAIKVFVQIPAEGAKQFEAKVCGICPDLDIALLKIIDYKNKHYCKLSLKENTSPGDDVYAVGFPLGQNNIKITKGIISGRQLSLIQTDTPINPGNSGGPLFKGDKVIGINNMIITFTNNIGYAIPISKYFVIEDAIMAEKKPITRRPFVGIEFNNSTESIIKYTGSHCKNGIYVSRVYKDTPAYNAGIREGNILCSINGIKIDNDGLTDMLLYGAKVSVYHILSYIKQNSSVPIVFWNGKKMVKSKISYFECNLAIDQRYPLFEDVTYTVFGGFVVMNLALNHLGEYEHLRNYENTNMRLNNKLIITYILPGTTASNKNIISDGDFITRVNNINVNTIDEYDNAIKKPLNVNGEYIMMIESENKNVIALPLIETIKNEEYLRNTYNYPKSKLLEYLISTYL